MIPARPALDHCLSSVRTAPRRQLVALVKATGVAHHPPAGIEGGPRRDLRGFPLQAPTRGVARASFSATSFSNNPISSALEYKTGPGWPPILA